MRIRTCLLTLALTVLAQSPAFGQVTFRNTAKEFGDAASDIFYVWTSPFRADGRDWLALAGVGAGFAALIPVDDQVDSWIVGHPNSAVLDAVKPFRESSEEIGDLSTGRRLFPISAVLIGSGMVSGNRKLREAGWGCLSAWQTSSGLRHGIYEVVSRERPSSANGNQHTFKVPGGEWEQHSFFGGHAANAWACTTYWNERFEMGLLEPVLYGAATGITLARMADRRHWASDTFLGAAVGYAIGRTVAGRYERREARREAREANEQIRMSILDGVRVTPTRRGIAVGWAGEF